jgi:site-specific DNA recombinase
MALAHKKAHREAYSPTPYGYDREGKELKQNGHELAVVALVKEMRDQGWALRKIAGALNEQGITSKKGGRWHPQTIKYLLENKLYEA